MCEHPQFVWKSFTECGLTLAEKEVVGLQLKNSNQWWNVGKLTGIDKAKNASAITLLERKIL